VNSTLVVIGRVVELLPARWTSPDGAPPPDPTHVDQEQVTIVTPVVLEIESPSIWNRDNVDVSSGRIVILAEGGQAGEVYITPPTPWDRYTLGEKALVTVADVALADLIWRGYWHNAIPSEYGQGWLPSAKYLLTPDGMAVDYYNQSQPLADVIASIQQAASSPFTSLIPFPTTVPTPPVTPPMETPTPTTTPTMVAPPTLTLPVETPAPTQAP
jgi:hypothetical protein